jgi:hypothetical protein
VSWSISAEMLAYLLFPLFLILQNRHRALPLALALIMLALLYGAGPIGPEPRMWHQLTYDYGFVRVLPAFLMGMSLWGCRDLLRRLPMPGAVLGVLCVLFIGGLVAQAPRGLLVPVVYRLRCAGGRGAADAADRAPGGTDLRHLYAASDGPHPDLSNHAIAPRAEQPGGRDHVSAGAGCGLSLALPFRSPCAKGDIRVEICELRVFSPLTEPLNPPPSTAR